MKKRGKWYSIAAIGLLSILLASCSDDNNGVDRTPTYNQHPVHYILIKGHVDKKLLPYIHQIKVISTYQTFNKACRITINSFEGVHSPAEKNILDTINVPSTGSIYKKIYIDRISPLGICQWGIGSLEIEMTGYGESFVTNFIIKSSKKHINISHSNYTCILKHNTPVCKMISGNPFSDDGFTPSNQNYIFKIKIGKSL